MIQKLKQSFIILVAALGLVVPGALATVGTGIASADIQSDLCNGARNASGTTASDCTDSHDPSGGLTNLARTVTQWFSIVVGAISIIMIVYGGFRYITSGGSSDRVGNAKNTIIYAIIGLIIVALAQLIVNFVLTQSNSAVGNNF